MNSNMMISSKQTVRGVARNFAHATVKTQRLVKASPVKPFVPVRPAKFACTSRVSRLQVNAEYGSEWNTPADAYVTLGLAHCFEKNEDGKVSDRFLIEPITANSLEGMAAGTKTCYTHVFSTTLGEALAKNKAALPSEFSEGMFCEEFEIRCDACARTWMRPHAMDNLLDIVPLGQVKSNFKYSVDDKRVLNFENVVNDDDNIKQDISIDVYGRKEKEELQKEGAAAGGEEEAEEEDELDALLG